jgi:acetylglutamate kinase
MTSNLVQIIKIGGNVIDNPEFLERFLNSFATIDTPKILVHGGGKLATRLCEQLQIPVVMHEGRRITDQPTLDVAVMVYAGLVNKQITASLQAKGTQALGMSGADVNLIYSQKRPAKPIDFGFVGDVKAVNVAMLQFFLAQKIVPVCCAITHDGAGNLLNTNADTIANELAVAVAQFAPAQLIYCFEKEGVLADAQDDNSVIEIITPTIFEQHKQSGVISGGMIPKLDNAFAAIQRGVQQVRIMSADALANGHLEAGTLIKVD